jgi:hypothetical protein
MKSSSILIVEDQMRTAKERVATANLAQNKSKVQRGREKKVQKYFLLCESCFWFPSYCEELYCDYEISSRSKDIITQNSRYPACAADKAFEFLTPISFNKLEKPSTGDSFH